MPTAARTIPHLMAFISERVRSADRIPRRQSLKRFRRAVSKLRTPSFKCVAKALGNPNSRETP